MDPTKEQMALMEAMYSQEIRTSKANRRQIISQLTNAWQHWSEQTSSLQPHDIIDNNQVWTQTITPSEESFHRCRAIKSSYYTLLMDGNTHQVNFKNVERRYKELKDHTGVMAMLIGNKSDLLQIRAVFVEDGSHLPREKASSSWKRLNWTQQKWRTHSHRC